MNMKIYKNPNPQEFAEISEAVQANEGYCPCLAAKNEDTKCMCKDFRDSTESDFCHCGRYYKVKDCEFVALVGEFASENQKDIFARFEDMLEKQNFIVIPIKLNENNPFHATNNYSDLCKAKVAKTDAVIILDERPSDWLLGVEVWATALNKKILHWSDLIK